MRHFYLYLILLSLACQNPTDTSKKNNYTRLSGKTMGTTYSIIYSAEEKTEFQTDIDSLLLHIEQEVSTYMPHSIISAFNQSEGGIYLPKNEGRHFMTNFKVAKIVYEHSEGAFDPTIMPLVNYWGFGYTPKQAVTIVDSIKIDSLLDMTGFDKVSLVENDTGIFIKKPMASIQLDFSGIAKGYGVDVVANYLETQNIPNYLVEIGRELRSKGINEQGRWWKVGLNTPKTDAKLSDIDKIITLENQGLATSGNYRNFYEVDGKKYGHSISPTTGFPEMTQLLSASVLAKDCMTADAYATAFMVMGLAKAKRLAKKLPELETYFIYENQNKTFIIDH